MNRSEKLRRKKIGWAAGGMVGVLLILGFSCPTAAQEKEVAEVRTEGNNRIQRETILAVMSTKVGEPFSEERLQRDVNSISDLGWFDRVEHFVRETSDEKVIVTIRVVENAVVSDVVIEGNTVIETPKLRTLVKTEKDWPLNENILRRDMERIHEFYDDNGYIGIPIPHFDAKSGVLRIEIKEAKVLRVKVEGLKKTKLSTVTRELRVKPGKIFSRHTVREDLRTLKNLDIFEEVDANPAVVTEGEEEGIEVTYLIKEKEKTGTAQASLGMSSRNELIGAVAVQETNFRGRAERLGVLAEFIDRRGFDISYYKPWIDSKATFMDFSVYDRSFFRQPTAALLGVPQGRDILFTEDRQGLRLTLGRRFGLNTRYSLGFRNERVSFVQREFKGGQLQPGAGVKQDQGRIMSLSLARDHDTRDFFFDPRYGSKQVISLDIAPKLLGGERSFQRLNLDLRRYHSFGKRNTLAGRLLLGAGFDDLPIFENYFVGGAETLRGYQIDRFVGKNMAVLNLELRHRLQKELQLVLFTDIGDAFGGPFSLDLQRGTQAHKRSRFDAKLGWGVGFRINTRFAIFRFDFGFGEDGNQTHFSIGPTF